MTKNFYNDIIGRKIGRYHGARRVRRELFWFCTWTKGILHNAGMREIHHADCISTLTHMAPAIGDELRPINIIFIREHGRESRLEL